jgi:hypothetical protein
MAPGDEGDVATCGETAARDGSPGVEDAAGEAGSAGWDDPDAGPALALAVEAEAGAVASGSSGVLLTGRRGAGDGAVAGAVTAGMDALAVGVPAEWVPALEVAAPEGPVPGAAAAAAPGAEDAEAGTGGGAVPIPNSVGEALGDDGSANGAAWAACCALVRSATRESVNFFIASASGGGGLSGTVDRFG